MAKGSKTGYKRNTRNKVQLKKKGSDESDEDYMASEDEVFELSEDEYCSSLADDESESEEEEWYEKKPKKAIKTRRGKGFPGRKKNGVMRPRRKVVSYNEEEDDYEDDGLIPVKKRTKNASSRKDNDDEDLFEPEEEEEGDYEGDGLISVKESTRKVSSRKGKDDDDLFEPEEEEEDYGDESLTSVKESKKNVSSRKGKDDDDDDDDEFEPEQEEEDDYDGLISDKENKKNWSSRKGKDDDDSFEPEEEEDEDDYEDDGFISVKESEKIVLSHKEKEYDEDLFEPAEDEEEEDYQDDGFISVKGSKKNVISHKVNEDDDYEDLSEQEKDEEDDYEDDDFIPVKESKTHVISRKVKEDNDNQDLFELEEVEEEEDDDFITFKESKKIVTSREEKENKEDLFEQEDDDFCDRKSKISRSRYGNDCQEKPRKKKRVSYREAGEDSESDDSDDEEFTPDGIDGLDDEMEETPVPVTKSRSSRPRMQITRITKGRRTKRRPRNIMNKTKRKNIANEQLLSKKRKSIHDTECSDEKYLSWKRTKNAKQGTRKKKLTVNSDSDFVSSGPSDHEFTISEEEREQVREASEFCKRLRRSDPPVVVVEKETVLPERKRPVRKGKEKMLELKVEVGKQVCGICLSEEGKRTVRGILNSCSHYFCFACIMEWSKVESRCPLCKQRFATITRTSRANGGIDSRDAVIAVPERDQVYQPSEEELRGYLDPYESVLCTECLHGGDDAHMLLCDLCDSPAHTYCVGLGHEVPDGNWYCDGCRPTILASQAQTPTTTDYRASNNSFANSSPPVARQTFDLNEMYVPDTPLTQVSEPSPLFRNANGDSFATSPTYGSGAFTLFERRRIQRQIHQFLNDRSRRSERSNVRNPQTAFASNNIASVSSTTLFGSQIVPIAPQSGVVPVRAAPERVIDHGRVSNYGTPSMYSRDGIISPRFGSWRGQMPHDQGSTSMNHGFVGLPQTQFAQFGEIEERIGGIGVAGGGAHHHLQPCSGRTNTGVGASISPFQFQEATLPSRTLQRSLQPPFN